jgi:FkbM family methyltransferase
MVVLDIGANIGLLSIIVGRAVAPGGIVYAFEPSPETYNCLQKNIFLNRLANFVEPCRLAASNSDGELEFYTSDDPYDTMDSAAVSSVSHSGKTIVPSVCLDSFCRQRSVSPDVLKIDVEGYEPLVLEGVRGVITQSSRLVVFLELYPWVWPSIGYDRTRLFKLLDELGLRQTGNDSQLDERHIRLEKA